MTDKEDTFDHRSTVFCANCHVQKADNPELKLQICGGCKSTWYCGKDCQRSHWKLHKEKCRLSQKQARYITPQQSEFSEMVRAWTREHGPLLLCAGKQVLIPSKGHLDAHLLDSHYIRVDITPSLQAPGGFEVISTHMGEMEEILSAFKGGSAQEEDGAAQYKVMIESAKRNERKLEPHIGDIIIGTMFIMVRARSGGLLQDAMMNMYPVNIQKKMADDWKEQERIENWGSWLTEAVLRGEADLR